MAKTHIIKQILELQNTLEDLSSRVENVVQENQRLDQENTVLGHYIEDLMKQSPIFSAAAAGGKKSNATTPGDGYEAGGGADGGPNDI